MKLICPESQNRPAGWLKIVVSAAAAGVASVAGFAELPAVLIAPFSDAEVVLCEVCEAAGGGVLLSCCACACATGGLFAACTLVSVDWARSGQPVANEISTHRETRSTRRLGLRSLFNHTSWKSNENMVSQSPLCGPVRAGLGVERIRRCNQRMRESLSSISNPGEVEYCLSAYQIIQRLATSS